jgi:cell division protein FtsN
MLVAVGCLGVLGLTFAVGFYSGRYWTRASLPPAALDGDPVTASAAAAQRVRGGVRAAPPLTFYEELTAPLSSAPAVPRATAATEAKRGSERGNLQVGRTTDRGDLPVGRIADRAEPPAPRLEERAPRAEKRAAEVPVRRGEAVAPAPRFTVQVAAYSARASAEALRNSISATGHHAYIVESDTPPGAPRYRVRVGSYASREAAIAAAARLPVPGARYVTTR